VTVVDYLIYAAIGKLIIYMVQIFPLDTMPLIGRWFYGGRFVGKLWACDLCLGVWIYFFLALIYEVNILPVYFPIVTEMIMGMMTSLLVHLISLGWSAKFKEIIIEPFD
jgi:hypothetical protein